MAAEPNVPSHEYYQRRYHVKGPRQAMTRYFIDPDLFPVWLLNGPKQTAAPFVDPGAPVYVGILQTMTPGTYEAVGTGVAAVNSSTMRVDGVDVGLTYTPLDGPDNGALLTMFEQASETGGDKDGVKTTDVLIGTVYEAIIVISQQPSDVTFPVGGDIALSVRTGNAEGYQNADTYEWRYKPDPSDTWTAITAAKLLVAYPNWVGTLSGEETEDMLLTGAVAEMDGITFRCNCNNVEYGFDQNISSIATGTAILAPAAPEITGVPTISGTEQVGSTLTAAPASVTGTAPITRTWQWRRDGTTNIGANSATYTLVAADEGATISAIQTETNAVGNDSAESAPTGVIEAGVSTVARLMEDDTPRILEDTTPRILETA